MRISEKSASGRESKINRFGAKILSAVGKCELNFSALLWHDQFAQLENTKAMIHGASSFVISSFLR